MALIGWPELIVILVILIFLFGATRLKDLSKTLGESIREFRKSSEGQPDTDKDEKEDIIKLAKKMGISTEGKNVQQILKEIEEKTSKRNE